MNEFEQAVLDELKAIRQLLERLPAASPAPPKAADEEVSAATRMRLLALAQEEAQRAMHAPRKKQKPRAKRADAAQPSPEAASAPRVAMR
jgi:hypothetical protein